MAERIPSPRLNYRVLIECLDCKSQFSCPGASPSTEILEGASGKPARAVMVCFPNACPECHNIRAVADEVSGG